VTPRPLGTCVAKAVKNRSIPPSPLLTLFG
jgi:hypothetical protein